jgi:methylated-DNA-[protein]-cysteine S-methyltransferase
MVESFNERVWEKMRRIPRGKVTTYKELAKAMKTKAYRAVGNACRRNPYAPIVPCHRVVKSGGLIGGFGGKMSGKNVEEKAEMLRKEGVRVKDGKVADFEKTLFKFK